MSPPLWSQRSTVIFQRVLSRFRWIGNTSQISLVDPGFNQPGRIDILLGVDVYVDVLHHGQRNGPPGSPTAFETDLGWVICVRLDPPIPLNTQDS